AEDPEIKAFFIGLSKVAKQRSKRDLPRKKMRRGQHTVDLVDVHDRGSTMEGRRPGNQSVLYRS
ncbi:10964_t:CDS:2, partial [Paraglomus occultum]